MKIVERSVLERDSQLQYLSIYYAIGRDGKSPGKEILQHRRRRGFNLIFDAIINDIPADVTEEWRVSVLVTKHAI